MMEMHVTGAMACRAEGTTADDEMKMLQSPGPESAMMRQPAANMAKAGCRMPINLTAAPTRGTPFNA